MSIYGLSSVKAPTKVIAEEVLAYLEHNGTPLRPHPGTGVPVVWGYSPGAEHGTGRALDFMVTSDTSVGNVIADYVWANRERFGLIHVIWRQRIRSTQVSPGQWRNMSDRGSPTENHMDHPHCFFDGRAVKGKSFGGSGGAQSVSKPSSSAPKFKPLWKPTGKMTVKQIQKAVGVTADGLYGKGTKAAVAAYQGKLGVAADGLWGKSTEAAHNSGGSKSKGVLLAVDGIEGAATVKALQRHVGVKADGIRGRSTNRAMQKWLGVAQDGIVGKGTIRALQRKVGTPADGIWGKNTTKALQRYLNEH